MSGVFVYKNVTFILQNGFLSAPMDKGPGGIPSDQDPGMKLISRLPRPVFRGGPELKGHLAFMNRFTKEVFDGLEFPLFLWADKSYGYAGCRCPCSTSYTVDVILGIMGHIVIDYHIDVLNVDAA